MSDIQELIEKIDRLDERLLGLEVKIQGLNARTQGLEMIGGKPVRRSFNQFDIGNAVDGEYYSSD